MTETDEKPGIEETYLTATTASNLRVVAEQRGAGDVLIAAGWSASRIGAACMRLHTEYDSKSRSAAATKTDVLLIQMSLKSLPAVREQLTHQAEIWQIDRPDAVALAVIAYWLDKNCHVCHGRKFQLIADTPSLSAKHCKACNGSGELTLRYGGDARRLVVFLDDCVSRAQQSIKSRLRNNY